jgi:hypothetical protein
LRQTFGQDGGMDNLVDASLAAGIGRLHHRGNTDRFECCRRLGVFPYYGERRLRD